MIYQTQAELDAGLKKWQEILGLQHWQIKAKILRESEMSESGRAGEITHQQRNLSAHIRLIDPIDYPDKAWEHDHEVTLVHELLHILVGGVSWAGSAPSEPECMHLMEERCIEHVQRALVALDRRKPTAMEIETAIVESLCETPAGYSESLNNDSPNRNGKLPRLNPIVKTTETMSGGTGLTEPPS